MPGRPKMSEQEKEDRRNVERYLRWLEDGPESRSNLSADKIQERLGKLPELQRAAKSMVTRLLLINEGVVLQLELDQRGDEPKLAAGFIDSAPRFSELRSISPGAWREIGVPLHVLRAAGIIESAAVVEKPKGEANVNSGVQGLVLTHLREHGPFEDPEGRALTKLADAMGLDTKSVSNAVRRLEAQGLAKRELKSKRRTLRLEAIPEVAA